MDITKKPLTVSVTLRIFKNRTFWFEQLILSQNKIRDGETAQKRSRIRDGDIVEEELG